MRSTLVIVPCGARKIWDIKPDSGPTRASDAYIGAPFKVNKEYAERFGDRWVILSAKHGFIDPDFVIPENYNVTFKKPSTNPVTVAQLREQIKKKRLDEFSKIVVLGGRDYTSTVLEAFAGSAARIETPLAGLPLGVAMGKVRGAIDNDKPLDR